MHMLYNSDHFTVVHFDVSRGGYEIVDKLARREIFLNGSLAEHFKQGVEELIRKSPTADDIDAYLEGFAGLAQQPMLLH